MKVSMDDFFDVLIGLVGAPRFELGTPCTPFGLFKYLNATACNSNIRKCLCS